MKKLLLLLFGSSSIFANQWVLIDEEDADGGKQFSKAIFAESTKQIYLWGTGGKKPARNVYERYELERFDPAEPGWKPAFPKSAKGKWKADDFPPFRIYGQSGPDGLKYDEGPRLQTVGGYHAVNRVRWWDLDGIKRPSPIFTFNMGCYDSKRDRIIYYSDGQTFALNPKTNEWTDLSPKNHPITCKHVAWASLCYDPDKDRILLFGGGLATNPSGGAPTWFFDCEENKWEKHRGTQEPPLRCNSPIVYDEDTQSMVMFGGYDQSAGLNDTWVFDCKDDKWILKEPKRSPPPMEAPATASLGNGLVLVCGNDARKVRRAHQYTTSAQKETWVYDINSNLWTPVSDTLKLQSYRWLTACSGTKPNEVYLVAFGNSKRQTYTLRYNPDFPSIELPGAAPGAIAQKYPEQWKSLADAPEPEPEKVAALLKDLPVNQFVDVAPPGMLISKTWSTAVMDTDRGEVIYIGGGHSGYSGNDVARYSIDNNRWTLDQPPRFPPFLEGTNAGIYGWSYGMMPFSQHTYIWYTYDPVSKQIVYMARPSIPDGVDVQVTDDPKSTFEYNARFHGYASWIYAPAKKKMHPPVFGRPFKNTWHLSLLGTPHGVFATTSGNTYKADVTPKGGINWTRIDDRFPKPPKPIKYHYEYQPLIHDTKRNRLLMLKGDKNRVDVYTRDLMEEAHWQLLTSSEEVAIGREAFYIPKQDVVLWLGEELHVLHCRNNQMSQLKVDLPKGLYGHECAFVYDSNRDLAVALIPSKFTGPMQTFWFRYQRE